MLPAVPELSVLTIPLVLVAVFLGYLYSIRNFSVFRRAGIPGPKPLPIFGNVLDMQGTTLIALDINLCKKYGKFVGTFMGSDPMLMVYDPGWLNEAFIKHFNVFTNRKAIKLGGSIDSAILSVQGEHWRHSRKMLSPAFTTLKLKKMMPAIQKCCEVFVKILEDLHGEPTDIRKSTNLLTLDVISTTAFGIESNVQLHPDGPFAQNAFLVSNSSEANNTFSEKLRLGTAVLLTFIAPAWLLSLISKVFNLAILNPAPIGYFESLIRSMLETRKKDAPGNDFLQILANNIVEAPDGHPDTLVDDGGCKWTEKGLTSEEVSGNSILFLFAGFQTTADSMMFIFYELAHHPHVESRLYEEIMEVCDTEEITVEQINRLKYLECCVNETLRLYPQGFRFDRVATQDITIGDISVTKGTTVTASPWVIHRDPEIWENPEEYDPERFTPERLTPNCSASYMPFGIGNRSCIGSRLALLEMKITVVCTMKAFRVEKNSSTPNRPIELKNTVAFTPLAPLHPLMISFVSRG